MMRAEKMPESALRADSTLYPTVNSHRAHVEVHGRPTSLAFLETTQTLTSPHYRLGIIITYSSVLS